MSETIKELTRNLQKIKEAYENWKKAGLNEELLIIYIADKTRMPKKDVQKMLFFQDKFFDELINKEMEKKLMGK